jgi:hypothetical protein
MVTTVGNVLCADQLKIEFQLIDLGKKILEQEDRMFLLTKRMYELRKNYIEKAKQEIVKKISDKKNQEIEIQKLEESINQEVNILVQEFLTNYSQSQFLEKQLLEDLMVKDSSYAIYKFNCVRYQIEKIIYINLLNEWQKQVKSLK